MSQYPSSIISFPTHVNGQIIDAIDVNSPDNEITAIQSFVGIQSSTFGITYDLRSPNSNGGGHIQGVAQGGTAIISYTKGDLLIASQPSTLSKLSVGSDGQVPIADSTQTAGVRWGGVATAQQIQNQTYTYARASVMSASVYGINLSQAVSVLTDGQAFAIKWPTTNTTSVLALSVNATGPSSVAARIKNPDGTNIVVGGIKASTIGIVEFDSVSSIFQLVTTPDAENLVGTLPAIDGSNLINVNVPSVISTSGVSIGPASTLSQVITHGLGKTPQIVRMTAYGPQAGVVSTGVYDNSGNRAVYRTVAGGVITVAISSTIAISLYDDQATDAIATGVVSSVTSSTFAIGWTNTQGNATTNSFLWEAQ